MAELATLARPYAKAVFDLAIEMDNFDEWADNLNFLAIIMKDPTMAAVISNPQVTKKTLTHILLEVCEGQVGEMGTNLLKILLEHDRLAAIPQLVLQYEALKAQHQGYITVDIATPYPLEPLQTQELETVLQKRLGKAVNISTTLDKSLLGGCLIRAGNEVIDVSIKGHLQQLAVELRH
ncbi:MAG: F0F1 ATP synthase subunit delta [Thiomargarita sp.]|nr:F0F1 ATP synthase subunit delta [Thiomargarita sp.]